jgi:hypothetical protein
MQYVAGAAAAASDASDAVALGKALQLVLQQAAAAENAAAAALEALLPTPVDLLGRLLGMVQLLLQKQHAGLSGGCLVADGASVSAAAAGLYVAIGLVVQLVPLDAAKRSVLELKAAMVGVELSGAPAVFQRLLQQR